MPLQIKRIGWITRGHLDFDQHLLRTRPGTGLETTARPAIAVSGFASYRSSCTASIRSGMGLMWRDGLLINRWLNKV
jgi:hypothetical protein